MFVHCVKMADIRGLTVCSFNVIEISSGQKRKDLLDYLCQHDYGIYLLQETHKSGIREFPACCMGAQCLGSR